METTFFTSVAKHDLERFHSECLAWLFNSEPECAIKFIRNFDANTGDIRFLIALTEVQQLDLVLYYTRDGKNKAIIIENKVKASEGRKKLATGQLGGQKVDSVWKFVKEKFNLKCEAETFEFSQTEYYYLRYLEKEVIKGDSILEDNCMWVYLLPAKVERSFWDNSQLDFSYDLERINDWRIELGDNPWDTFTYVDLYKLYEPFLKDLNGSETNSINSILIKEYIKHIGSMSKKFSYELKGQFDVYSPANFGAYEYFKVLKASLEKRDLEKKHIKNIYSYPGSSNNREPILDLILFEDKEIDKSLIIFNGKEPKDFNYFNIGIQVQGFKVKFFIASKYYDYVSIKESDEYLQEFNKLVPFSKIENISKLGPLKLSKQRGKTFLNYNFSLTKKYSFSEMHDLLYDLSKCFSESLNLEN